MAVRSSMDRSTMFTCLLDLSERYGKLTSREGEAITTAALNDWYEDPKAVDMYAFCREWIKKNRKDLLPIRQK